jgi:hypothetical protein
MLRGVIPIFLLLPHHRPKISAGLVQSQRLEGILHSRRYFATDEGKRTPLQQLNLAPKGADCVPHRAGGDVDGYKDSRLQEAALLILEGLITPGYLLKRPKREEPAEVVKVLLLKQAGVADEGGEALHGEGTA